MDESLGREGIHNSLDLSLETGTLWCENCMALKKDIEKLENQHTKSFQTLKEKIISTDLLIKKYKAKCDDYDNQAKQLEEAQKKLQHIQRQAETLEAQLRTSLQETEPLRQKKTALEAENRQKTLEIESLTDKIKSVEKTCQQYQLLSQISTDQNEKYGEEKQANLKKIQALQSSNQKQEAQLEKLKAENKNLKSENSKYGAQQRKLEAKLKQTMEKIDVYFRILKENNLLPRGEKKLKFDVKLTSFSTSEPDLCSQDEGSLLEEISKELAEGADTSSEEDKDDDSMSFGSLPWTFSPIIKLLSPLPPTPVCFTPFIHSDDDDEESMSDIAAELENELNEAENPKPDKDSKCATVQSEKKKKKKKLKKKLRKENSVENIGDFENTTEAVDYENIGSDGIESVIKATEMRLNQGNVDNALPMENLSDSESTDVAEDNEDIASGLRKGNITREDTEGFLPALENVEADKSISVKRSFDSVKDDWCVRSFECGGECMLLDKEMGVKSQADEKENSTRVDVICERNTAKDDKNSNTCIYGNDRYKESESSSNKGLLQRQRAVSEDLSNSKSVSLQVSEICDEDNSIRSDARNSVSVISESVQTSPPQKEGISSESDALSVCIPVSALATNSVEFLTDMDSKRKSDMKENVSLLGVTKTESEGNKFLLSHTKVDFPVLSKEERISYVQDEAHKQDSITSNFSYKQSDSRSKNGSVIDIHRNRVSEQAMIKESTFLNELASKVPAESAGDGDLSTDESSSASKNHDILVPSSKSSDILDRIDIKFEPYLDKNIQDGGRKESDNSLEDTQKLKKVNNSKAVARSEPEVLDSLLSSDILVSEKNVFLDINDKEPSQENLSSHDVLSTSDEEKDHENKENLKTLFENRDKKRTDGQDLKHSGSTLPAVLTRIRSKKYSCTETGRRETMIGSKRTLRSYFSCDISVQDGDQSELDVTRKNKRSRFWKPPKSMSSVSTYNEEDLVSNDADICNDDSWKNSSQRIKTQISEGFDVTQFDSTELKESKENDTVSGQFLHYHTSLSPIQESSPEVDKCSLDVAKDTKQVDSLYNLHGEGDTNYIPTKNSKDGIISISPSAKGDNNEIHDECFKDRISSGTITNEIISGAATKNVDKKRKGTMQNEHSSLSRPVHLKLSYNKENSTLCYTSTSPNTSVSNTKSFKSLLLGLPSGSMYLSPEIENITASSALMLESQPVSTLGSLISPLTSESGIPSFSETGNSSPVHSMSPVSPLPISPFKFIIPISPLPPSPVYEREALSPLPNSPFESMQIDTETTPKAKSDVMQRRSSFEFSAPESATSQSHKTPTNITPVPSFLTPLPPTPNSKATKTPSSVKKGAPSKVNTPCNFHAEVPSGAVAVKPKPVCTRTLSASFSKEKVADDEKATSVKIEVEKRTQSAKTNETSNRSRRKRMNQDQMKNIESSRKKMCKEGKTSVSDDGEVHRSLIDIAANFKVYQTSQQSAEEFVRVNIENVSIDMLMDIIIKEAIQVLSKSEADLLEDVYRRCVKEIYQKDKYSLLPAVEQKILALFRQLFQDSCQETKKPILMEALWNHIFIQDIPQNHAGKAALCKISIYKPPAGIDSSKEVKEFPYGACSIVPCRMFTALSMDAGSIEEVRVMLYNVMIVGYLSWGSLAVAIAMIWPQVFLKSKAYYVMEDQGLCCLQLDSTYNNSSPPASTVLGLCKHLVSGARKKLVIFGLRDFGMVHVVEFILTQSLQSSPSEKNTKIIVCMQKLCGWSDNPETAQKLLKALLEQLQAYTAVDHPSHERVFELEKSIELLCKTQGWVFIKDEFVRIGLQTLSNKWQAKGGKCGLPIGYVCSILRLTGTLIAKINSPKMRDVTQILRNWLLPILSKEPSDETVQAHCIDTILVISPQTPRIISSLHAWYCKHPLPLPEATIAKIEETRKLLCARFNVDCSPFLPKKTS